jgi:DNA-binding transcriptional regulator GbsR (MarR family)
VDDALRVARERLIEALGRQSSFWGLGKITGELYAVLYLSEEPMSLSGLAAALGVTKGNVSVAIRLLEQLGMVRRSMRPGDRRVFFEAELDFWSIARRVLERRQKPEFNESFRMVRDSLSYAGKAQAGTDRDFVSGRLERLQHFYEELDEMVKIILLIGPEQLSRLARLGMGR